MLKMMRPMKEDFYVVAESVENIKEIKVTILILLLQKMKE